MRIFLPDPKEEVRLKPVPKGVMHRTRAPVRSVILMIEGKGVVPTGD